MEGDKHRRSLEKKLEGKRSKIKQLRQVLLPGLSNSMTDRINKEIAKLNREIQEIEDTLNRVIVVSQNARENEDIIEILDALREARNQRNRDNIVELMNYLREKLIELHKDEWYYATHRQISEAMTAFLIDIGIGQRRIRSRSPSPQPQNNNNSNMEVEENFPKQNGGKTRKMRKTNRKTSRKCRR